MKLSVPAVCLCLSTISTTVLAGNNIVLRTFRSLVTARIGEHGSLGAQTSAVMR
jgi:hypothetical protein